MTSRATSFGAVAGAYDRFRLGYPEAITSLVLDYARAPVATALEVGAGTGKATPLIAGRGIRVTAAEPDPQMAAVLAANTVDLPVTVVVSSFEAYEGGPFDLLYAASAWHWTDPATRWPQTAALLRSGGTAAFFASAGGGSDLADPDVREAVAQVRRRVISDEERITHTRVADGLWWPGSELEREPAFTDVTEHDFDRVVERSREDYVGALGTDSAYLVLDPAVRRRLLDDIAAVVPDTVQIEASVRLHLARRV